MLLIIAAITGTTFLDIEAVGELTNQRLCYRAMAD